MQSIYVIRHGETDYNKIHRIQGTIDTNLNDKGVQQAEIASELLKTYEIDVIVSSPLKRAYQTAEVIANQLGKQIIIHDAFVEKDFGILQGKTLDEIEVDHGVLFTAIKGTYHVAAPRGETNAAVINRVEAGLKELACKYHDKKLLIVTHGGVARVLYKLLDQPSDEAFFAFKCENCELQTYEGVNYRNE